MSRLVVTNSVTLDGVMQSPSHPGEDTRGGFERGGWQPPYVDSVMGEVMAKGIAKGGSLLFGRRTTSSSPPSGRTRATTTRTRRC
jgi:hypothetical protein